MSGYSPFDSLPNELLTEIAKQVPHSIPVPFFKDASFTDHHSTQIPFPLADGNDFMSRWNTLQALSQTCRRLRACSLPVLWQSFDVCEPPVWRCNGNVRAMVPEDEEYFRCRTAVDTDLCCYLIIMMNRALASPDQILPSIRRVNVVLPEIYDNKIVFVRFAQFINSLPNLKVLQILRLPCPPRFFFTTYLHKQLWTALGDINVLDKVHTATIPQGAAQLLVKTPKISRLFVDNRNWDTYPDDEYCGLAHACRIVANSCPLVEEFGVSTPLQEHECVSDFEDLESFITHRSSVTYLIWLSMPKLRTLPMIIFDKPGYDNIARLALFPNLTQINICYSTPVTWYYDNVAQTIVDRDAFVARICQCTSSKVLQSVVFDLDPRQKSFLFDCEKLSCNSIVLLYSTGDTVRCR